MPSHEYQRICRDMSQISDSISISCTKDGVSFASTGDLGSGRVTLKQNTSVDKEDEQVCACMCECLCDERLHGTTHRYHLTFAHQTPNECTCVYTCTHMYMHPESVVKRLWTLITATNTVRRD